MLVDGRPLDFAPGDNILVAMLRGGLHPTGGGCLCLAGDCPHCLATVDGVAYVRTCQTPARPGLLVERHPTSGYPPLPTGVPNAPAVAVRNLHCDVVIIGQGSAGQAAAEAASQAGKRVITLDAKNGQEVIGIYAGPLVAARTTQGMLHVHAHEEIVVATGAAEIQPVAPGNQLAGILTPRAASQLVAAGIDLGRVVVIGEPFLGSLQIGQPLPNPPQSGEGIDGGDRGDFFPVERLGKGSQIVRFEGEQRVEAVVVTSADGQARRIVCDTVVVGLGLHPRDALLRMGHGLPVRAVGEAAQPAELPPCPLAGTVCTCSGVSLDDLQAVWDRGFGEMELIKRATLAGTGACQGAVCLPHLRAFLADRGGKLQAPFTARPVTRQLTMGEVAAGAYHRPTPRTALDGEHRRLGAQMDRIGGWWRPWHYGAPLEEYWAVREAVSIGDVSTLGKMVVAGPAVLELLERLYPTKVATIGVGKTRYVLLLDDRGYILDDGLIGNEGNGRYTLTFTSGGANTAEMWVRDWAESWGLDVRILNQTMSLGAINVTGPLAKMLLGRAGLTDPPKYMQFIDTVVADIACRVYRLSFTGELSYELHHSAEQSVALWRRLLELGADLGVKPHGIQTLLQLRLEKGHILVGQDTDFDSTPRRVNMEWAVKLDKEDFVGRQAVLRTNKIPLDKQLVGLEMEGEAPFEGSVIYHSGGYAGYVTSSCRSPLLGKTVMLAWLRLSDGRLPELVTVDGRTARRVAVPFYDKEGARARA
jgi:glycine cleavage system aminomethyltransferase T